MTNPQPELERPGCYGTHPPDEWVPPTDPCWAYLRRPFPPEAQGKLTKSKTDYSPNARPCNICGAKHQNPDGGVHVDYIGHAFLRERLNEVDYRLKVDRTPQGDPMVVQEPGDDAHLVWLPFRLTVMGVTREEVGACSTAKDEWPKVLWSDVITRGAMAHGIGLWLWQKEMPVDRERSTSGRGRGRQQTEAEAERVERTRHVIAEMRTTVEQLDDDERAAWEAYKTESGFDPTRTTLEAAEAAADWLQNLGGTVTDPGVEGNYADSATDGY